MEKLLGQKGICFRAYLEQILEPIIFPLFEILGLDYIYMENRSKIYKGKARLPHLEHGVYGFNWPFSSPDLNFIKKI
jgi:hypothetical protein